MTLLQFLEYAAGPGVNAVVGFLLSFAVDMLPGFESMSQRSKRLLTMWLSFFVPLLAMVGLIGYGGRVLTVELVWAALLAGFAAYFGSQTAHIRQLSAIHVPAYQSWRKRTK